mmetsp:Transcript_76981/g.207748  ORF Transcript_76981/g.207748 Transcript_76981/m.207748 type:complete len:397 (-) Transcript_76981:146-1336(-)
MPDIPPDWLDIDSVAVAVPEPPPAAAGLQGGIWQALCSRMMTDIHRNNAMSEEEQESSLRKVVLQIPGDPPGRVLNLIEDPKGVISVGATGSVWLYDLVPKTWKPASGTPAADGSLEDVEAEFERLTGIRPERLMPADFKRTDELQAVPSKAQIAAALKSPIKDTMVQDMLDRGLGDYLCDIDEDLSKRLAALDLDRRPRTAKQKQAFAAAFYVGEEPPSESIPARRMDGDRLTPEDEQVSAISSGGAAGRPTDLMASERADAADAEAPRPSEDAPADTLMKPQHGTAKLCLPGLLWDVDVSDKDQRLTATVSFGEDAWWALQGSKARTEACTVAFKESVDFQLSDKELRVLHEGISVLELDLPLEVDATHAAAKLCSRRRRVVVRAPLRSSSAVS